ncbi:tetratricopeptide repeat protein [Fulvivirga maritima]|uniref:tetratricopeptide repeat protein n=1 Tax=Fulvivirga maritima TaxID=2904247 RepID=UPI001F2391F1|nr:tetratricopeptide repeat protein [Fulvivirga maritima]UII24979.1 tetratricopeptide repeat protein [Fulvivirga maritima]
MKKLILFILVCCPLISFTQDKAELLKVAESTISKGDTTAGLKQFQFILTKYPQSFTAAKRLAETYFVLGDYHKAVQYCNIAMDITDNYQAEAEERMAKAPDTTTIENEKIAHYISDRAEMHHLKGNIRVRQYQRNDAIEEYRKALELKPSTEVTIDLALAYLEIGFQRDAIKLLRNVIAAEPHQARGYFNLGNVYNKLQEPDSALANYRKAIKYDPELKWPYLYSGILFTRKEKYDSALYNYDRFLAIDSTNEEVLFRRAVIHSELRNWRQAINDWHVVLALDPDNADAWRNQGLSYFQLNNYDSAILSFDQALKHNPEEAYTYINRGYSYYLIDNPEKALEDLNYGLNGLKNYYLGYYFRALTYQRLGKKKEACEDLSQAMSLGMKEQDIDKKAFKKCF